jgi:hypothetical protein
MAKPTQIWKSPSRPILCLTVYMWDLGFDSLILTLLFASLLLSPLAASAPPHHAERTHTDASLSHRPTSLPLPPTMSVPLLAPTMAAPLLLPTTAAPLLPLLLRRGGPSRRAHEAASSSYGGGVPSPLGAAALLPSGVAALSPPSLSLRRRGRGG